MVQNASEKYTLLYPGLAREGYRFIFVGPTPECDACRLQGVCLTNLEPGRLYEVISVRNVVHECSVHENVVTVTVREPELEVAIRSRLAMPGSTLTWENSNCDRLLCEHHNTLCRPEYLQKGDRLHIKKKSRNIKCSKDKKLTKIEVIRLNRRISEDKR